MQNGCGLRHPALAEQGNNFVVSEFVADREWHAPAIDEFS
jgi:hypothetical protein